MCEYRAHSDTSDQVTILRPNACCSLSHLLRASSVVLVQQLHAATETFGSVNMCMLNTDLDPVCGTSEPWALVRQTGGARGRFVMDTASLKSSTRPVAHWRQLSDRDVLTMCVLRVCSCARWLKHTQRGESHPLSVDQTLQVGSEFTIRPDILSALILCHGSLIAWTVRRPQDLYTESFQLLLDCAVSHVRVVPDGHPTFHTDVFPALRFSYSCI